VHPLSAREPDAQIEDEPLVIGTALRHLGVQHLDLPDGSLRLQHRLEESPQDVAVLFGGEQHLEDDVELRIENFHGPSCRPAAAWVADTRPARSRQSAKTRTPRWPLASRSMSFGSPVAITAVSYESAVATTNESTAWRESSLA